MTELTDCLQAIGYQALNVFDAWEAGCEPDGDDVFGQAELVVTLRGTPQSQLFIREQLVFEQDADVTLVKLCMGFIGFAYAQQVDTEPLDIAGKAHDDGMANLMIVVNLSHGQVALVMLPGGKPMSENVLLFKRQIVALVPAPTLH